MTLGSKLAESRRIRKLEDMSIEILQSKEKKEREKKKMKNEQSFRHLKHHEVYQRVHNGGPKGKKRTTTTKITGGK